MKTPVDGPLAARLEALYAAYTRPEFIAPDPLECVFEYASARDREVAGLLAACLAFGNVRQIVGSVRRVLAEFPRPRCGLLELEEPNLPRALASWRHRYASARELYDLLTGIRNVLRRYGALETCFVDGLRPEHATTVPALVRFVGELRRGSPLRRNYLLPDPARGSACKRLHLFLRWMVRRDAVDPGPWRGVCPSRLVVPLDTHMHRTALALGLTCRKQGDLRAALEVTTAFRRFAPGDPVKYDFALTRLGIRKEAPGPFNLA